jgi:ATP-grasp N-terminal domain
MSSREHVVLIDQYGYRRYRHPDGEPFLDPARYEVTLITPVGKADEPGPGEVRAVLTVNPTDTGALTAAVREVSASRRVDRLLAVSERHLMPAARVRDALGLSGPSLRQMLPFLDKVAMKEHLRAHKIPIPSFMPVRRPADAAPLLRRHGRILFKPRTAQGAVGVCVVSSRAELDALDAAGFSHPGRYEAEQFIAGEMFHVDTVAERGRPLLALASQYLEPTEAYLDGGPRRSVNLDPGPLRDALLEFNARLIAAYPWFSGATHAEMFRDLHGRLVLCEIAGRPGGGGIIPAFKNSHQIDLCAAAILPQLDLPLPAIKPVADPDRASSGWVILYADPRLLPGVLAVVDGVPPADWVVAAKLRKEPGTVLDRPAMSGDGVMVVTVCGPDTTRVTERLDQVAESVTTRIEPLSAPPPRETTGDHGGSVDRIRSSGTGARAGG